jgi:glycine/D-amino acid oxidase-like deaminating enzyme
LGLKGDVFELTFENHSVDFILNRELFVLPFTNNRFKAGSTYRRKFDNNSPDEIGKTLLENGLNKILKVPYSIQNHDSAVRPTAGDHHPILGEHPQIKNMYCLNGLGSKGVTLAPYATKQLFDAVFSKKEIDKQLNISRFYSLFYKKKY